ncbi:hypothetical protein ODZ83_10830 [Acaricomes phytoseiuli]|nr:hypothetical protein [Acaricomes phytoseiuli]
MREGFQPRARLPEQNHNEYYNVDFYVFSGLPGDQGRRPSGWISTTMDPNWRPIIAEPREPETWYRYEIFAPGGVDARRTLGNTRYRPYMAQQEILFLGGIDSRHIRNAQAYTISPRSQGERFQRVSPVEETIHGQQVHRVIRNADFNPNSVRSSNVNVTTLRNVYCPRSQERRIVLSLYGTNIQWGGGYSYSGPHASGLRAGGGEDNGFNAECSSGFTDALTRPVDIETSQGELEAVHQKSPDRRISGEKNIKVPFEVKNDRVRENGVDHNFNYPQMCGYSPTHKNTPDDSIESDAMGFGCVNNGFFSEYVVRIVIGNTKTGEQWDQSYSTNTGIPDHIDMTISSTDLGHGSHGTDLGKLTNSMPDVLWWSKDFWSYVQIMPVVDQVKPETSFQNQTCTQSWDYRSQDGWSSMDTKACIEVSKDKHTGDLYAVPVLDNEYWYYWGSAWYREPGTQGKQVEAGMFCQILSADGRVVYESTGRSVSQGNSKSRFTCDSDSKTHVKLEKGNYTLQWYSNKAGGYWSYKNYEGTRVNMGNSQNLKSFKFTI